MMNAVQLIREQLQSAHETIESTMADVSHDVAHFTDTGKALPVGAAYAHAVMAEDMIIAGMLAHTDPVSKAVETGLSEPLPSQEEWVKHETWAQAVKVDLPKLKAYAQKVYAASDAYLATLSDEGLDKEMDLTSMGMGKKSLAWLISNFVVLHSANLAGEISAAKGVQGLKGYPF